MSKVELEKDDVEDPFVKYVASTGFKAVKYELRTGDPDRLVLLPWPHLFFIEFKRKGETPRKIQRLRMAELSSLGYAVHWTDNLKEAKKIYDKAYADYREGRTDRAARVHGAES